MAIENLKKHLILALLKFLSYNFGYICSQNGSNPQEYLAKFGYKLNIEIKKNLKHLSMFFG